MTIKEFVRLVKDVKKSRRITVVYINEFIKGEYEIEREGENKWYVRKYLIGCDNRINKGFMNYVQLVFFLLKRLPYLYDYFTDLDEEYE